MKTSGLFLLLTFVYVHSLEMDASVNVSANSTSPGHWVHHCQTRRFVILARATQNGTYPCATSSEEDFPAFIPVEVVEKGAIVVVFCVGIYCFTLLAIICNDYFLPCVERICEVLHLSPDVAAATFMSIATSAPELFVNIIGTFITESDMGIGTIVGSSMFNTLGVASIGSLTAVAPIQMHWWPVTRDVAIYIMSVVLLVVITWDGLIFWYEGLILFAVYFVYFTVMFQNPRISRFVMRMVAKRRGKVADSAKEAEAEAKEAEAAASARTSVSAYGSYCEEVLTADAKSVEIAIPEEDEEVWSPCRMPKGSVWNKIFFFYSWPLKTLLYCTVPNPARYPKLFPITFILCIFWIGSNSYVVSWMITIVGGVFHIPDAVLGMTFLAGGGCLPESISITIMSRRGEGSMGVSNSLGGNTMNILMSLGIPWFLKTIIKGPGPNSFITITSGSIEYTVATLILVALILYVTLYFNNFQLRKRVGFILLSVYVIIISLAILSEMVFFEGKHRGPSA